MSLAKRSAALTLALLLALLAAPATGQEWKGKGRLEGRVLDLTEKPLEGATVKLRYKGGESGPDVKTDKKGRWTIMGLRNGEWRLTVEREGFVPGEIVIQVSEYQRANPLEYKMEPVVVAAPEAAGAGGLPPEVLEAVKQGNEAIEQKRWADGRAAFEKALPAVPDNVGLLMALARCYSGEGNTEKAVETLRKVTEKEPANYGAWLLTSTMLLEQGKLDEGRAALEKVPKESITDPNIYINVGVLYMNKAKNAEAEEYFTKAVDMSPTAGEGYYYRGLARVAQQKNKDAKADLAKFVELAPNAPEAAEAKQLIGALK